MDTNLMFETTFERHKKLMLESLVVEDLNILSEEDEHNLDKGLTDISKEIQKDIMTISPKTQTEEIATILTISGIAISIPSLVQSISRITKLATNSLGWVWKWVNKFEQVKKSKSLQWASKGFEWLGSKVYNGADVVDKTMEKVNAKLKTPIKVSLKAVGIKDEQKLDRLTNIIFSSVKAGLLIGGGVGVTTSKDVKDALTNSAILAIQSNTLQNWLVESIKKSELTDSESGEQNIPPTIKKWTDWLKTTTNPEKWYGVVFKSLATVIEKTSSQSLKTSVLKGGLFTQRNAKWMVPIMVTIIGYILSGNTAKAEESANKMEADQKEFNTQMVEAAEQNKEFSIKLLVGSDPEKFKSEDLNKMSADDIKSLFDKYQTDKASADKIKELTDSASIETMNKIQNLRHMDYVNQVDSLNKSIQSDELLKTALTFTLKNSFNEKFDNISDYLMKARDPKSEEAGILNQFLKDPKKWIEDFKYMNNTDTSELSKQWYDKMNSNGVSSLLKSISQDAKSKTDLLQKTIKTP